MNKKKFDIEKFNSREWNEAREGIEEMICDLSDCLMRHTSAGSMRMETISGVTIEISISKPLEVN